MNETLTSIIILTTCLIVYILPFVICIYKLLVYFFYYFKLYNREHFKVNFFKMMKEWKIFVENNDEVKSKLNIVAKWFLIALISWVFGTIVLIFVFIILENIGNI